MPEVIINGPDGRLECRCRAMPDALTALFFTRTNKGGTMNNRVTYALYKHFQACGFAVLVLISVRRSQGEYDNGEGELPTRRPQWIGCRHKTQHRANAGSLDFHSAHGLACN